MFIVIGQFKLTRMLKNFSVRSIYAENTFVGSRLVEKKMFVAPKKFYSIYFCVFIILLRQQSNPTQRITLIASEQPQIDQVIFRSKRTEEEEKDRLSAGIRNLVF